MLILMNVLFIFFTMRYYACSLVMIHDCPCIGEEFIRYLLSATLAGGLESGSRLSVSAQVGSPTPSLPSTSTVLIAGGPRH